MDMRSGWQKRIDGIIGSMKPINFKKLLKNYDRGWVAISADFSRVISYGKTLSILRKKTKDLKEKVFYFPSGERYSNFVG